MSDDGWDHELLKKCVQVDVRDLSFWSYCTRLKTKSWSLTLSLLFSSLFAQVKVREATSNDPWGPSSTMMSEIADLTYNVAAFSEIMQMVWKRLNDHGKNWRHVYKALVLLEYLIKTGSEKVLASKPKKEE